MELVLAISADGTLSCLYNEHLDLESMGACRTQRASNVEWSNERQKWVVTLANGEEVGDGFDKRSEAIAAEVKHLNGCIKDRTISHILEGS